MDPVVIPILVAAIVVVFLVASTVRIVPQARRYNIERFGRYRRTLQPGLNFVLPVADRINTKLDVREQVYSSDPRPVITEDNLVVNIDTVLYYQITDPPAASSHTNHGIESPSFRGLVHQATSRDAGQTDTAAGGS